MPSTSQGNNLIPLILIEKKGHEDCSGEAEISNIRLTKGLLQEVETDGYETDNDAPFSNKFITNEEIWDVIDNNAGIPDKFPKWDHKNIFKRLSKSDMRNPDTRKIANIKYKHMLQFKTSEDYNYFHRPMKEKHIIKEAYDIWVHPYEEGDEHIKYNKKEKVWVLEKLLGENTTKWKHRTRTFTKILHKDDAKIHEERVSYDLYKRTRAAALEGNED